MKDHPKHRLRTAKQFKLKGTGGWGGRRKGAGRPNRSGLANHMARPNRVGRHPLHITLRLKPNILNLRQKRILAEFKQGIKLARKQGFSVLHFSLQSNHLHIVAEVTSNANLAAGMRSLAGRFARKVRSIKGGHGAVFVGRYYLHVLKTPSETKRAIKYVLLNMSKHGDVIDHIDSFSSGDQFRHWRQLMGRPLTGLLAVEVRSLQRTAEVRNVQNGESTVFQPQTWLARQGWMLAR